ncbi:MAG TPA: hypothetical protein PKC24_07725, partial [Cyclobacteriaceae bacterium]|nr:hypothetical protein [Cyclobacteriaceae bacterium]
CLLFFILLCSGSCSDDHDQHCGVDNPIEDLSWLAERVEEIEDSELAEFFYITKASYKLKTVFIIKNCCPFCASVYSVHDCSGKYLGNIGTGKNDIDQSKLKNETLIWEHTNTGCNV